MLKRILSVLYWPVLAFIGWTQSGTAAQRQRRSEIGHLIQNILVGSFFGAVGAPSGRLLAGLLVGAWTGLVWSTSREVANAEDRGGWTHDETRDLQWAAYGALIPLGVYGVVALMLQLKGR